MGSQGTLRATRRTGPNQTQFCNVQRAFEMVLVDVSMQ